MKLVPVLVAFCLFLVPIAMADEGMWTFDNFPSEKIGAAYGFAPTQEWLDRVRLASARTSGCSTSFVSPEGLVMTNHHCVEGCIHDISTLEANFSEIGFVARTASEERKCPRMEVNQLVEIRDVTAEVSGATKDLEGEARIEAQRAIQARLEKACAGGEEIRCDLVGLYQGGQYKLYKYRRWRDVRLVFAPEASAGSFGGDLDNFNFPRYDMDVAFLRVYEGDAPVESANFFRWSPAGAKEGDLVFVPGSPGRTSRLETIAQLEYERDVALPDRLAYSSELRGMLTEFGNRGPEQRRVSQARLTGLENGLKVLKGRQRTLNDPAVFARKVQEEQDLRRRVDADPALKSRYGGAWDAIAAAQRAYRDVGAAYRMIEGGAGFSSELFGYASMLVRGGDELVKPDEKRLPQFTEARLSRMKQRLLTPRPLSRELDTATFTFSLTKLREELGADDPFVHRLLGERSPREVADAAVNGSRLDDPRVREALFTGGRKAVEESDDPMIVLARKVDPDRRALRRKFEDEIDAVISKNEELVAKARFAVYGTSVYPDATGSPRLSFGTVKGWTERGKPVPPFTTFRGLFERWTGREPFDLPKRWLDAKSALDLDMPLNFVTTNDIIGGNSGSAVIDREGRIVGVAFDGNIHSIGGDYWFDPDLNRTVVVGSRAILEALEKVYGARGLAAEIRGDMK